MAFCKECGNPLNESVAFCTECGATVTPTKPQETTMAESPKIAPATTPQTTYTHSASISDDAEEISKPVSTGGFFGLMLLFMLPVVGLIACIICAFAPSNKNIKHFARAYLIWLIIAIVLGIVIYFAFAALGNMLNEYLTNTTGGDFKAFIDGISDLKNIAQ